MAACASPIMQMIASARNSVPATRRPHWISAAIRSQPGWKNMSKQSVHIIHLTPVLTPLLCHLNGVTHECSPADELDIDSKSAAAL
jgi:hypothetical protein